MIQDMTLATRTARFGELINRCLVTRKLGDALDLETGMTILCNRLEDVRKAGNNLYVLGNGGSAGVASHAATDFFNVAKLKAFTLHEPSMLTCMANDFGYENAFAKIVSRMVDPGDAVIAISSSGKSMNIRNAVIEATQKGALVITLSGFSQDNPLRLLGDINIWLDSGDYGFVEIGHQFILHNISDRFGAGLTG